MTKAKKLLALVLVAVFVLSVFPMTAFAVSTLITTVTTVNGVTIADPNSHGAITDVTNALSKPFTLTLTAAAAQSDAGIVYDYNDSGSDVDGEEIYVIPASAWLAYSSAKQAEAAAAYDAPGAIVATTADLLTHLGAYATSLSTWAGFKGAGTEYVAGQALYRGDIIVSEVDAGTDFYTAILVIDSPAVKDTNTINGEGKKKNVVLVLDLPTDLNFAIDPLETVSGGVPGSQIKGTDYRIVNHTNAIVKTTLAFTAGVATGVKVVEDIDDVIDGSNKNVLVGILAGTSLAGNAGATTTVTYEDGTDPEDIIGIDEFVQFPGKAVNTNSTVEASFVTTAATAGVVDVTDGEAVFSFYGAINDSATWVDNDLQINATYTLSGVRSSTYDATIAPNVVGLGLIGAGDVADGSAAHPYIAKVGTPLTLTVTKADLKAGTGTSIKLSGVPTTVALDTVIATGAATWTLGALPTGHFEYGTVTGVLTLHRDMDSSAAGARTLYATTDKGVYVITLNLQNNP
jgi:hypothetical protein